MSDNPNIDHEYVIIGPEIEQNVEKVLEKLRFIIMDLEQKSSKELEKSLEFRKQSDIAMTKKCLKTKIVIDLSKKTIENLLSNLEDQQKNIKQVKLISYLPNLVPFDDNEDDDDDKMSETKSEIDELQNALKYLLKAINILQKVYDNNDQVAEQEMQNADEYQMQKNTEMFQKCLDKKDSIESNNVIIVGILSKLQKQQFVIKDFQMTFNALLNSIADAQSNDNIDKNDSSESQLTTDNENQRDTFADPFNSYDHFLKKIDEKLVKLIGNPKFSPDANNEEKISAIDFDLDTNDIIDANPFGSSFFDADENEVEGECDDFDGFVKF